MALQQSLNIDQVTILKTRSYLTKNGLFTVKTLSTKWNIGKATTYRYWNNEYRLASVKYSKDYWNKKKQTDEEILKGNCFKCNKPHIGHRMCKLCTRLLHGDDKCCLGERKWYNADI